MDIKKSVGKWKSIGMGAGMAAGVLVTALLSANSMASPSFSGPDSVSKYHPLCLETLKGWQDDGGALDMKRCAYNKRNVRVSKTSAGAYLANKTDGSGYIAYKPIGTLDNSMELLLVYDKQQSNPISAIYFLGRIPGTKLTRDFLTTIEEGGDRCFGGVSDARLISASELEIDVNATVHQMLTFLEDRESTNTANISFKPANYQAYACAGTITKTYNLTSNQMRYSKVSFTRDESRKVIDRGTRCYDKLVAETLAPPRVLDMQQYQEFLQAYKRNCGSIR